MPKLIKIKYDLYTIYDKAGDGWEVPVTIDYSDLTNLKASINTAEMELPHYWDKEIIKKDILEELAQHSYELFELFSENIPVSIYDSLIVGSYGDCYV